jgi:serine protease Do
MASTSDPLRALQALSDALVALAARVLPNVVALTTDKGAGSGFVLDNARHVVTNFHVIDGCDHEAIKAAIHGFPTQRARVVGRDQLTDLAVLELAEPHESFLELREEPARLGEMCMAVGSPLGLFTESVSTGIVSGLARSLTHETTKRPLERLVQTDCAINPGNSGGPLVDMAGRVIGVNTMVATFAQGIGFAVPTATVRAVTTELIAEGRVVRASLGVAIADRDVELDGRTLKRQVVTKVRQPRETGLKVGDVLLSIDGAEIDGRAALYDRLTKDRIGQRMNIDVHRDGAKQIIEVIAERLPD